MPSMLLPNALFQQWKPGNDLGRSVRQPPGFDRFRRPETGTRGSRWRRERSCLRSRRQMDYKSRSTNPAPGAFHRVSPEPIPDVSSFVPVSEPDYGRIWDQSCLRQWLHLASADGHLPGRARKAVRFGPPRLASPGFVKKLRHAGTQCHGKAAQRVDPDI